MYSIDLSLTNGLGKPAISIYYSGCDIPVKCKECHNPELWNKQKSRIGYPELLRVISSYNSFNFSKQLRIAFLGGEPFSKDNRESVISTAKQLKDDFKDCQIIVYSWRKPDEIEKAWVENIDIGVLGQFDIGEFKEGYLPASSNQVIYDFNSQRELESIKLGEESVNKILINNQEGSAKCTN